MNLFTLILLSRHYLAIDHLVQYSKAVMLQKTLQSTALSPDPRSGSPSSAGQRSLAPAFILPQNSPEADGDSERRPVPVQRLLTSIANLSPHIANLLIILKYRPILKTK
ncbi:hypothetical protein CEXT_538901 [Caerostris extrusa]|uniref:Uncharacterized protein n=1 Tax=Caerostris extrusa TaxID=172846 RepID=A0AAV4RN90_CAEEX|nr:hypothetical protein CEXT_538901 [Caerostris extrusa]